MIKSPYFFALNSNVSHENFKLDPRDKRNYSRNYSRTLRSRIRGDEGALTRHVTKSALTTKNRFLFFALAWKRRGASGDQKRFRPAQFFFRGEGV